MKRLHQRVAAAAELWRRGWWLWFETLVPIFTEPDAPAGRINKAVYKVLSQVNRFVQLRGNRELWRATTPDYPVGCKRILITSDWYPDAAPKERRARDRRDRARSSEDAVGRHATAARHPADAIVFGTGFTATEFLAPMKIEGRGGRRLAEDLGARRRGVARHRRARTSRTCSCSPGRTRTTGPARPSSCSRGRRSTPPKR